MILTEFHFYNQNLILPECQNIRIPFTYKNPNKSIVLRPVCQFISFLFSSKMKFWPQSHVVRAFASINQLLTTAYYYV